MLAPSDAQIILKYLDLPPSYSPSPSSDPKSFLEAHIHQLPPNLLARFAPALDIHERSSLPVIRNRRTQYVQSAPREYTFEGARKRFPDLWESIALASGRLRPTGGRESCSTRGCGGREEVGRARVFGRHAGPGWQVGYFARRVRGGACRRAGKGEEERTCETERNRERRLRKSLRRAAMKKCSIHCLVLRIWRRLERPSLA
jgi:hypothetical protein